MTTKSKLMAALLPMVSKNPTPSFKECRAALRAKGIKKVFPISYGRALALVGKVGKRMAEAMNAGAAIASTEPKTEWTVFPAVAMPASKKVAKSHDAATPTPSVATFHEVDPLDSLRLKIDTLTKERDEARARLSKCYEICAGIA